MTKVLLVDDDPVVLQIYQRGLTRHGMEVVLAGGGLAAVKALHQSKPDVVVLDLMMPNFSGVEVLKFIRGQAELATLPVVVLSNAYMDDLSRGAAALGAQRALLKAGCTPALLTNCLREVLEGRPGTLDESQLIAAPVPAGPAPAASPPAPDLAPPATAAPAPGPVAPAPPKHCADDQDLSAHIRAEFLARAPATRTELRKLYQAFEEARNEKEQALRLEALYRKVHFLTASAGFAERHTLAVMASVFEAMLYQMMDQPARISPSTMRTTGMAVDFLESLLGETAAPQPAKPPAAQVLVVDDDALSNRLVVAALRQAKLQARSTQDPLTGLEWLTQAPYDLVLLDLGLPGIDGFEFYKRMRALPGYEKTPVIYVTAYVDFDSSIKNMLGGEEDVIAKPVMPAELAVKVVMQLSKGRPGAAS